MPHLKDTRERSLNMEFYFVDGWNGIADFQCRSSAGGVHVILIKQVWKDTSLGSQSLMKLNATTRHICVRFVSWRSTYGFGRTDMWSLQNFKCMEFNSRQQSLMKLKATTMLICVRFVSWRSTYGFGRTNTWSCKAMEVSLLIKVSQTYKLKKQEFFYQTISHWSTT